ncbi:MAG: D-alanyl-D-alanine carboxypeptidase [Brockia lithotrophica]|uniref:serine-type D-Ala-D-Ala carboxypeptidase n=1 Tax=Brockia lithotrophica TaxID=933949 RepID=A0A2T5G611_9BACL|nr:MAG: D-alanyl-D-alanine carboxypeptidase [Brockia lithotrophica]
MYQRMRVVFRIGLFLSAVLLAVGVCFYPPTTVRGDGFPWEEGEARSATAPDDSRATSPAESATSDARQDLVPDLAPNAKAAILIEATTGAVLYEKEADTPLPPASMTKVMTMLLVAEAVDAGRIRLEDRVVASERAARMGGSQVFLAPGEEMSLEDLLKSVAIASANDAAVALAEHVAGSVEQFVELMNRRARELGLEHTTFRNVHGLPEEGHVASARDLALLGRELVRHAWILEYTGRYEDMLREGSAKPFWLVNTNRLVKFYPGMDGLKTGYTAEARYGLVATAKRGSLRFIAVVMGEPDVKTRNREVTTMLDYGFAQLEASTLYARGERVARLKVAGGTPEEVGARAGEEVVAVFPKGKGEVVRTEVVPRVPRAPFAAGIPVGEVVVRTEIAGKTYEATFPLLAEEAVRLPSLPERIFRGLRDLVP